MLKKLFILFKIARKLALSDALKVISKFHQPPLIIKILVNLFSISFSKIQNNNLETLYKNYSKLIPKVGEKIVGEKKTL